MNKLLVFTACYLVYLVFGAAIFYFIETESSDSLCKEARLFYKTNKNLSINVNSINDVPEVIKKALEYQRSGIKIFNETVVCQKAWDFQSCLFFAGTIITTIGYGHIIPSNGASRAFTVIYALIGIPIFTIMFGAIGDLFSKYMDIFMKYLEKNVKSPKLRGKKLNKQKFHAWMLAFVFGSIGFLLLSLIPAIIFTKVEGWHVSESLYFTIITLTTIGFGDYVPGSDSSRDYVVVYRTMVFFWILFGLAYTATFLKVISNYLVLRAESFFSSPKKRNSKRKKVEENTNIELQMCTNG